MADLPRGIVTFLFTDIEGSTRLWERDADLMWAALARHNALLDEAITDNGGFHFKTIGDAYQAAFADPVDALRATVDAQRRFAAETWEETGPIRVRMALHMGHAEPKGGDYLAPCLNRLSRLLSTGYGAQVLLSNAVRTKVKKYLPEGVTLRDLGKHRLRDLLEPEKVTQLVIEGLPDTFPPLKSLERHPTNLPIQPNPLVGREAELATIATLMTEGEHRLVTLTGMGGTGKTRLALQAGAEMLDAFFDGVFFVDLAPLSDPSLVVTTIAATLGVREGGGLSLAEALVTYLDGKQLLLILDNFEHLPDAADDIAGLLEQCAEMRVLVTSRAALRVRAEHEIPISPLPVPEDDLPLDELAETDAVSLFVQRAAAISHGFALTPENADAVSRIVARLEGIPLAIELAASRIRTLTPQALLERLDHRLDVLSSGARDLPARQRTLRATVEWSHALLPEKHQRFFERLAVFHGGFDLDAAQAVAAVDGDDVLETVTSLVDRSLVRRAEGLDAAPRFTMLETLREFGMEQLERAGCVDDAREAHADWYIALAESAEPHLTGPEQAQWLDRLELEHDNMRAALAWSATPDRQEQRLRLVTCLSRFWLVRGHLTEGRRWLDEAIDVASGGPASSLEIRALIGSGNLAYAHSAFPAARHRYESALEAARAIGDRPQEATLLNSLGNIAVSAGRLTDASDLYSQSLKLSEELGDAHRRATALGNLGAIAHYRDDVETALAHYHECLKLWHELGNIQGTVNMLQNLILLLAPLPGHADRARIYASQCLKLTRQLGDKQAEALALSGLGVVEQVVGNIEEAERFHLQSLDLYTALQDKSGMGRAIGNLGMVALDTGDTNRAVGLLLEAFRLNQETAELDGIAFAIEGLGGVAASYGQPAVAVHLLGAAERLWEEAGVALPGEIQQRHDSLITQLRGELGTVFDEERFRGRNTPLDDLVRDASQILKHPKTSLAPPAFHALDDIDELFSDIAGNPGAAETTPFFPTHR